MNLRWHINTFAVALCFLNAVHSSVSGGYVMSVSATIEKRFELSSRVSGFVVSSYEIGSLCVVGFVSYLGTKSNSNIPRWIGVGALFLTIGSFLFASAHFLVPAYRQQVTIDNNRNSSSVPLFTINQTGTARHVDICHLNSSSFLQSRDIDSSFSQSQLSNAFDTNCDDANDLTNSNYSGSLFAVFIFVIAQILIGAGGSPIFTIGATYIDNHVKKGTSSMYLAVLHATSAFGPVCGYLVGSQMIRLYVDEWTEPGFNSDSTEWVGRWWAGFIWFGAFYFLAAIPFFIFPRRMTHQTGFGTKIAMLQGPHLGPSTPILEHSNRIRSIDNSFDKLSPDTEKVFLCELRLSADAVIDQPITADSAHFGHAHKNNSANRIAATRQSSLASINFLEQAKVRFFKKPLLPENFKASRRCCESESIVAFSNNSCSETQRNRHCSSTARDILRHVLRLVKNPVYMLASLNACVNLCIISGFSVFLPKYLETQFQVTKSHASLLTGCVAIPGAIFGIVIGGALVNRLKLEPCGSAAIVLVGNIATTILFLFFFLLGCENPVIAGLTTDNSYETVLPTGKQLTYSSNTGGNTTTPCNADCSCSLTGSQMVCGSDGVTYLSACFAGCTGFTAIAAINPLENPALEFTYCHCIATTGASILPKAIEGPCVSSCEMLIPFLVLLFVLVFAASITQMPIVMITLRSVREQEKAFALGLQVIMFRILRNCCFTPTSTRGDALMITFLLGIAVIGYIPAPIIYGWIIDTTCLLQNQFCNDQNGACLLYDIEAFRLKYGTISIVLKVFGTVLSFLLCWSVRKLGNLSKIQP